jgi:hypothetical protein
MAKLKRLPNEREDSRRANKSRLQKTILLKLRDIYPEVGEINKLFEPNDQKLQTNLFYLVEHDLIESEAVRNAYPMPRQIMTAEITARGLDFLEDDGGLGAILNVVTIRLETDTLRQLLETKINASDMPEADKQTLLAKLKSFSGDVLKSVIIKLIEKSLERRDMITQLWAIVG